MKLGLEAYFFESRVGLDLAVYKTNSFDQIFSVPVSRASGYNSMYVNGGEMENKGMEIALHLVPVKSRDFTWNIDVNWFTNQNTVDFTGRRCDQSPAYVSMGCEDYC